MTAFENLGNIAKRISAAVLNVGIVKKSGRNQHYKYDYATAEDVKAGARRALAEAGISILPLMRKVEQRQSGKMTITRAHFDFVVACEEGHIIVPWIADSQDAGDKGINKCATIATKYFLINLLQIPTGVEEDPDGEAPKKAASAAPPRRQPRKQTPQPVASNGKMTRPMEPQFLRDALHKKASQRGESGAMPATDKQILFLARKFQEAFASDSDPEGNYHAALNWLWKVSSAKELSLAQAGATLDWLLDRSGPDDTGDTPLHAASPEEARRVLHETVLETEGR